MDKKEAYFGHPSQISGVEEHRLVGGKGDGIRLFQVKNGLGLEFTVSADRGADISRLSFRGMNYGYFPVGGYCSPAYYDDRGNGWIKTTNLGFLATCGLTNIGIPSEDDGEILGQHGRAHNTPAEHIWWEEDQDEIQICARLNHSVFFGEKLIQNRQIVCSKNENRITLTDRIENVGDKISPLMILYHINIGYPLLDEDLIVDIPSTTVTPRDEHANEGLTEWNKMIPPQPGFVEMCYYHHFDQAKPVKVFQPKSQKGVAIYFDPASLDEFIEWKMMGVKEYVLGLEPANSRLDGRAKNRRENRLKLIHPGQEIVYQVRFEMIESL
ncbi:MAG TPA: aldose 1-epimerase family protein [Flexilinea sp.]|nr:aldose 1-epimerase family protein [Flexilinea sp.]